jgi:hypothetical protein
MLFSEAFFDTTGVVVSGATGKIYVVTGIDVVSAAGTIGQLIQAGLVSSGATMWFNITTGLLAEYASWRGALPIGYSDGLEMAQSGGGSYDVTVWGFVTAALT